MFILSAAFLKAPVRRTSVLLNWYALALLMIATGLFGFMLQSSVDSLLVWASRSALYLSGVYMLIAAIASFRESNAQLYNELRDLALDGIVVHEVVSETARGKFIQVNPAICSLLGYTKEEMHTLTPLDIMIPEDRKSVPQDSEILNRDKVLRHTKTLLAKDGRHIPAEINTRLYEDQGRPMVLSIIRDITDRKRAEEELRENREDLDHAQAVGQIGSWRLDVQRNVLTWSDENHRIFGVPKGTPMTYETFLGAVHPDDRQYVDTQWTAGLRGEPYDIEHRIVVDGQVKWVREKAYLEFADKGNLLGGFGITQDITERKQAEQAQLASEKKYRELVESANSIIIRWKPDGEITYFNRYGLSFFGYREEEILGRNVMVIIPDQESSGRDLSDLAKAIVEQPEQYINNENENVLADGRRVWVQWTNKAILDEGGNIREILAIGNDITERKRAEVNLRKSEEALRLANEQLEQRVLERTTDLQQLTEQLEKSRGDLRKLASELVIAEERERKRIAGVLHDDIAQILASARMRLDMLEDIPSDQEHKVKEAKALLQQSLWETRALMNDLGNPVLIDLGLQAACEALAKQLMERNPIRIRYDIQDTFKHISMTMKAILYQIIRELLNNVVKHSKAQNANLVIRKEDEHYRVQVTDDGVGFNPQTYGGPTAEGGYGLYSIRERLIAVDGSLTIESTPGTGTVVTAILPETLD
jgi:PAS domain S-box-containing protein